MRESTPDPSKSLESMPDQRKLKKSIKIHARSMKGHVNLPESMPDQRRSTRNQREPTLGQRKPAKIYESRRQIHENHQNPHQINENQKNPLESMPDPRKCMKIYKNRAHEDHHCGRHLRKKSWCPKRIASRNQRKRL